MLRSHGREEIHLGPDPQGLGAQKQEGRAPDTGLRSLEEEGG